MTDVRTGLRSYDLEMVWEALLPHLPGAGQQVSLRNNQRSVLKQYLKAAQAEHADVLRPSSAFLQAFLRGFSDKTPGYVRNTVSNLKGVYTALRGLGLISRTFDPLLGLEGPSLSARPGEERRQYTDEELARLITGAPVEDRCLLLLGAHAGLRTGEVVALEWAQVRWLEGALSVHGRQIPRSPELDDALRAWGRKHGGLLASGPVFEFRTQATVRARLGRRCAAAHVEYRPWQALRASYGSRLWQETRDPVVMMDQLGIGLKAVEAYLRMDKAAAAEPD
jgi:integrase